MFAIIICILIDLTIAQWQQIDSSFTDTTFQSSNGWTTQIQLNVGIDSINSNLLIDTCTENPQQLIILNSSQTYISKIFPMRINEIMIILDVFYSEVKSISTPRLIIQANNKIFASTYYQNWSMTIPPITCNNFNFTLQTLTTNATKVDDSNVNITFSIDTIGYEKIMIRNMLIYAYFCSPLCQTCQSNNFSYCITCNDGSATNNGICSCPENSFSLVGFGCIDECPRNNYTSDYINRRCVKDLRMVQNFNYFDMNSNNSTQSVSSLFENTITVYSFCNDQAIGQFFNNQGFQYQFSNISAFSSLRLRMTLYTFNWEPNSQFFIYFNNAENKSVTLGPNSTFFGNFDLQNQTVSACNPDQSYITLRLEAYLQTNQTNPTIKVYGNLNSDTSFWVMNNITIDVLACSLNCQYCMNYNTCQTCVSGFVLYNKQCVSQYPIYTQNGTDQHLSIPFSQYIAKGFYDNYMTLKQINSFFDLAPDITYTGQNFSFFPNKIVLGGFMVWNNGNYSKTYRNLQPHYAISVWFNITFIDYNYGTFYYRFDDISEYSVYGGNNINTMKPMNIIGTTDQDIIIQQYQHQEHNGNNFTISFQCLNYSPPPLKGFCAISEYYIILHKVQKLVIQCVPNCISCQNYTLCNQCEWSENNKYINNRTNCYCNQFHHRIILNNKCQCPLGYYEDVMDSNCWPICGDGLIVEGEDCDDGNFIPFDGCHQCQYSCQFECDYCNKGVCEQCQIGYELKQGLCYYEQDVVQDKQIQLIQIGQQFLCIDQLSMIQQQCQKENDQQIIYISQEILTCPENCLACTNGICVKCYDYWDLWDNKCNAPCGNSFVQENEQCDNGLLDEQLNGCFNCKCVQGYLINQGSCQTICGDNYKTADEECDDGNTHQYDGCYNCQIECKNCAVCVKYHCQQCDLGYYNPNCSFTNCGDGIRVGLEECDDGNSLLGDGCVGCKCEKGWLYNGFGCLTDCGDELIVGAEECDDGNTLQNDGCFNCLLECKNCSICKRGVCLKCQSGYYFDEKQLCTLTECGDGIKISQEQCDDGNKLANDSCFDCKCEQGWRYDGKVCQSICGDGLVVGKEECDDGNQIQFDGCFQCQQYCYEKCTLCQDKQCQQCVDGFTLISNQCINTCGDGILNLESEQCDDSNQIARDGCFKCQIEKGYICYSEGFDFKDCETCKGDQCASCSLIDGKQICVECNTGYYIDETSNCYICDKICLECVQGPKNCIKFNYDIYQVKSCNQAAGLYYDYASRDCHSICGDQIISGSEICDDGNSNNNDGCSSACLIEQGFLFDTENKQIIKQPKIEMNQKQSNNYMFQIKADAHFQAVNCSNTQVKIEQFEMQDFNYSIPDNQTEFCIINMKYFKTIETYNTIHIYINFKSTYQHRLLKEIEPQEVVLTPQRTVYATDDQTQQGAAVAQTSQTFTSTIMVLGPLAALIGGFKFVWAILDVLSWMNNFYYLNVSFPENVRQMFLLANWGNVINIPSFKVFNNEEDPYYFQSPQKFHEKDVDPLFFNNIQTVLIFLIYVGLTTLISHGIKRIIKQFYHRKINSPKKMLVLFKLNERTKQVNDTQSRKDSCQKEENVQQQPPQQQKEKEFQLPNKVKIIYSKCQDSERYFMANLLRIIQTNYLDIMLAIMLQITNQQTSVYFIVKLNIILAYVSVIILLFLLYFTFKISITHKILLEYEKFTNRYDCFYEGIQTESPNSMLYSFANLLRKTIFIFSIVFFYEDAIFQTFICFLSSLLNVSLILFHNPFKSKEQLMLNFVPDFGVFIVVGISILFAFQDKYQMLSDISIYVLGWFIVISVYISIGLQMLFLVKNLLVKIIGYLRQVWSQIREKLNNKN